MSESLIKDILTAESILDLVSIQVQAYKNVQMKSGRLSSDDLGGLEKAARIFNMLRASARQDGKHQAFGSLKDGDLDAAILALEAREKG